MAINLSSTAGTLLNGGDGGLLSDADPFGGIGGFYDPTGLNAAPAGSSTSSLLGVAGSGAGTGTTGTADMGEMTITGNRPTTPNITSISDLLNLNPMDILQPVPPAEDNIPEMTITADKPVTPPPVIDKIVPTTPPPDPNIPEMTITADKPKKEPPVIDQIVPTDPTAPIIPTDPNDIVHHDVTPPPDEVVDPVDPTLPPVIPPVTPTTPLDPNVPKEDNSNVVYTSKTSSILHAPSYTNNPNELQAAADSVAQRMTRGRTSTILTGGQGEDESKLATSKLLLGR